MENKLRFSKGNAKLKNISIFSLVAGFSCPSADQCLSKADRETGKLTDGPNSVFRCYAASQENLFKNVRQSRWRNFELIRVLRTQQEMVTLIQASLPEKAKIIRVHEAGDFFSNTYFLAWMQVARQNPDILFYAYTKSLPFWIRNKNEVPTNFKLTASYGGKFDELIEIHGLKYCKVLASEEEATANTLPVDHDDSNAYMHDGSFAINIHGTQPKDSQAGKFRQLLRTKGITGYNRGWKKFNTFKKKKSENQVKETNMGNTHMNSAQIAA